MYWLTGAPWVPIALAAAYLAILALNTPPRVLAATAVFLGLFLATLLWWVPLLPLWAYGVLIPVFYVLQNLSHKVFHVEHDMTEYNAKYPKGRALFVVLLFYEVPIIMNYLVFGRKNWAA